MLTSLVCDVCNTYAVDVLLLGADMKAERTALLRRAVPELQDFCSKRGLLFQLVDLNWGMEPEEHDPLGSSTHRRHQEITDCQRLSLGPNFVVSRNITLCFKLG